jgi:hypothetical protein
MMIQVMDMQKKYYVQVRLSDTFHIEADDMYSTSCIEVPK